MTDDWTGFYQELARARATAMSQAEENRLCAQSGLGLGLMAPLAKYKEASPEEQPGILLLCKLY